MAPKRKLSVDFAISDKMQTVIGMIDEFVARELVPLEPLLLQGRFEELEPEVARRRRMVKQMELWAPNHPAEYGGMGLDLVDHADDGLHLFRNGEVHAQFPFFWPQIFTDWHEIV